MAGPTTNGRISLDTSKLLGAKVAFCKSKKYTTLKFSNIENCKKNEETG